MFAPVFAGWGSDRAVSDHRNRNFVDPDTLFFDRSEAQDYADNNRRSYPGETTGKVVAVNVTIQRRTTRAAQPEQKEAT
jgi:hypothetical protein